MSHALIADLKLTCGARLSMHMGEFARQQRAPPYCCCAWRTGRHGPIGRRVITARIDAARWRGSTHLLVERPHRHHRVGLPHSSYHLGRKRTTRVTKLLTSAMAVAAVMLTTGARMRGKRVRPGAERELFLLALAASLTSSKESEASATKRASVLTLLFPTGNTVCWMDD